MSDEKDEMETPEAANDDGDTIRDDGEGSEDGADEAPPAEPTPDEIIAELKDQLLRSLAETENVRRRAEREVADARRFAATGFARDVLTVADNLQRATETAKANAEGDATAVIEGVELTLRQLEQMLEKHEVEEIEALGLKLDPNLHQAMVQIEDGEAEPGTIIQVMAAGYTIHGRLLRPAMVAVAKAPKAADTGQNIDTEA